MDPLQIYQMHQYRAEELHASARRRGFLARLLKKRNPSRRQQEAGLQRRSPRTSTRTAPGFFGV
ncbi:hypothetical protein [Allokutzneria sp. NRRL B-24872]|uniref:hypothetical protein n=1 Tax=Allokutzneria sp. NRRL B-24872 TaxID=1137961 RepID=UPI000A35F9FA|nr:hypothetical protein [Allokutzneria sp. NRRL B-24872]